jgi:hypothetical protein
LLFLCLPRRVAIMVLVDRKCATRRRSDQAEPSAAAQPKP